MSTFKITPTERRTGNTAPSFFVEARTEKEAERAAVAKSRLLEEKEWKAVSLEKLRPGQQRRKKNRNKPQERKRMLIVPNRKAA